MTQFRKIVSGALALATALTMTGLGAGFGQAAQLKEAAVSLSDSRPSQSSVSYTISFKLATTGNVGSVKFVFANTASGSGLPTGLSTTSAAKGLVTIPGADTANWTIDNSVNGTVKFARSTQTSGSTGDLFTFRVDNITNSSQAAACDVVSNSDSCWIQITTYSDTAYTTVSDNTTTTYTIVDPVTVTATVDPILKFTVAGMTANSFGDAANVGSGTQMTSTVTTLPFGNITVGTPKLAQHSMTVQANANNGYNVYAKFITTGGAGTDVMTGNANTANNIDKFTASGATWSAPQAWASPTGSSASVNSAWLGIRTSDTGVAGFNVSNVYGPPDVAADSGSGQVVKTSAGPDNGGSASYVTYKIEANAFQPADLYTGTVKYSVVSSF